MTTPTGTISLSDVNVELGRSSTANISMNEAAVRTLAGVGGSGTVISMDNLRGKSSFSVSYPSNVSSSFSGYDYCGYVDGQVGVPTISGGTGSYSYSWARISGSTAIEISSSTVQRPVFFVSSLCNDTAIATWRVTVTSGSATKTADVDIALTYFSLS
jgi:hypothetical protein